ncbi:hypothetical protein A4V08_05905 [Lachnoclostridium sp. YL32]|nr:hypothetical protein A4V08_05905 [Lachnoclostridium sp. YL32]
MQLLDFSLLGSLIHASQPIRTTFTGQWFASGFLQTPPHDDALAIGCTLPTAGRVRDFHPLERAPAGRTHKGPFHFKGPFNLQTSISWLKEQAKPLKTARGIKSNIDY